MANRLKMRILLLLSLVYINCDYLQAQITIPRFEEGERVVFVGNSITHGGHYHSFIWLYYMTASRICLFVYSMEVLVVIQRMI